MSGDGGQAYHMRELEIARDPTSPAYLLPVFGPGERTVLDVGCGAGQTLIAAGADTERRAVGLDIDPEALALGRTLTKHVEFVAGRAEQLPFASESFDLVISRVALPYAHIPRALGEMARVLKAGGRCWLVLHAPSFAWGELLAAARRGRLRALLYQGYVLANGLLLALLGRQVAYPLKRTRFESVQTVGSMRRALGRAGFIDVVVRRERFFVVTARRR